MSKTLYVVTSGEYSDYGVSAIFDDRELAAKYIAAFTAPKMWAKMYRIEEWELNPHEPGLREGFSPFFLRMSKTGEASDVKVTDSDYQFGEVSGTSTFDVHDNLLTYCFARDAEHAIKIANERRLGLLAANRWGNKAQAS